MKRLYSFLAHTWPTTVMATHQAAAIQALMPMAVDLLTYLVRRTIAASQRRRMTPLNGRMTSQ